MTTQLPPNNPSTYTNQNSSGQTALSYGASTGSTQANGNYSDITRVSGINTSNTCPPSRQSVLPQGLNNPARTGWANPSAGGNLPNLTPQAQSPAPRWLSECITIQPMRQVFSIQQNNISQSFIIPSTEDLNAGLNVRAAQSGQQGSHFSNQEIVRLHFKSEGPAINNPIAPQPASLWRPASITGAAEPATGGTIPWNEKYAHFAQVLSHLNQVSNNNTCQIDVRPLDYTGEIAPWSDNSGVAQHSQYQAPNPALATPAAPPKPQKSSQKPAAKPQSPENNLRTQLTNLGLLETLDDNIPILTANGKINPAFVEQVIVELHKHTTPDLGSLQIVENAFVEYYVATQQWPPSAQALMMTQETPSLFNGVFSEEGQLLGEQTEINRLSATINRLAPAFDDDNAMNAQNRRDIQALVRNHQETLGARVAHYFSAVNPLEATNSFDTVNGGEPSSLPSLTIITNPTFDYRASTNLFWPTGQGRQPRNFDLSEGKALLFSAQDDFASKGRDVGAIGLTGLPEKTLDGIMSTPAKDILSSSTQVAHRSGFYFDKGQQSPHKNNFVAHVDFANRFLGGAWRTHGMAQEEIAVLECRGLRDAAVFCEDAGINLSSDDEFTPNPLLIENTLRVAEVRRYGREANHLLRRIVDGSREPDDLYRELPERDTEVVNWLALAAPDLRGRKHEGRELSTLIKLFNNAVAGFSLVSQKAHEQEQKSEIRTGKWGCGAFENDLLAVLTTQITAALVANVDRIVFYDINAGDEATLHKAQKLAQDAMRQAKHSGVSISELPHCIAAVLSQPNRRHHSTGHQHRHAEQPAWRRWLGA